MAVKVQCDSLVGSDIQVDIRLCSSDVIRQGERTAVLHGVFQARPSHDIVCCHSDVGCRHGKSVIRDVMLVTIVIRGRSDGIACGGVQRYSCIAGIVSIGADSDALARSGNTRREGEAMDAAGAVTVARIGAHVDGFCRAIHGAAVVVVGDKVSIAKNISYDSTAETSVDGSVEDEAVLDGGRVIAIDMPGDATNKIITCDAGISEGDIFDGAFPDTAEETLIICIGFINSDAADGVAIAVEDAAESFVFVTDGGIVVLSAGGIVPSGVGLVIDVVAKFEVLATVFVDAVVHIAGEQVETGGCGDGVGLVLAAVGIVSDAPMVCPLGVEDDNIVIVRCEVRNILSVGVAVARAVGCGAPSGKCATRASEGIGGEVLRSVIGESHVAHRARATVGVEADGIGISRQLGVEGSVGSDIPVVGTRAVGIVIIGTAAVGRCIVAAKGVACPFRNGDGGHGGVIGSGDRCGACSGGTLVIECYGVGIGRPMSVEVDNCTISSGEIEYLLPVGVNHSSVGRGAPSVVGIASASKGVGGEVLCHIVSEVLVAHLARGAVSVEAHFVCVSCPIGGEGLVAVRAGRDGDGCLRRIPVATRPAG